MNSYFSFDAKLTRSEFFKGWIFGILVLVIFQFLSHLFFLSHGAVLVPLTIGFGFLFLLGIVPMWMGARFRDAGHSPKWALLALLFFPFPFLFFASLLMPSKKGSR